MTTRKQLHLRGVTLSYLEQNGPETPTLFFVHGNSSTAAMWQKQFDSPELAPYRLVAFDLPGHGQSDGLEPEQYNLPYFGLLVADAVRQLAGKEPYLLVGFSFGANVVAEMLAHHLQPAGLALLGPTIIGGAITLQHTAKKDGDYSVMFMDDPPVEAVRKCIQDACLSFNEQDHEQLHRGFSEVQAPFRSAILQSAIEEKISDEIALLQNQPLPVLVLFGADERLVNPNYLDDAGLPLWNDQVYKIPGGSHFISIDQPKAVNSLMVRYVQEVVIGTHASVHSSAAR